MSLFPDFGADPQTARAAASFAGAAPAGPSTAGSAFSPPSFAPASFTPSPFGTGPLGNGPLGNGGLFAHDFDSPAPGGVIVLDEEEPPPAEPPPPPITAEDLTAACAAAHAAGRAEGLAAVEDARAVARAALLGTVSAQLAGAEAQLRAAVDAAGTGLSHLVLAVLQAGFPTLGARHGAAEIARFTREVTALLATEPRIVIRVHPAMLPAVDEVLDTLEPERREAILVEPRDTLPPGDARIAWRHGLAVRDSAQLLARVGEVLVPLGLTPSAEPAADEPAGDDRPEPVTPEPVTPEPAAPEHPVRESAIGGDDRTTALHHAA
jgi:flagellar assembly protein FliH